jgi:hypothetical protein
MSLRFDQEDALQESNETSLLSSLQLVLSVFMRKHEVEKQGEAEAAAWTNDCEEVLRDFMQSIEVYVDGRIKNAANQEAADAE